jgi:hypothetical protein
MTIEEDADLFPDTFFLIFLAFIVPTFIIAVLWLFWRIPC